MSIIPAWVFKGAKVDMDFLNQRYYGGNVAIIPSIATTNVSTSLVAGNGSGTFGYAPDITGIVRAFPQYCPRITAGYGLWVELNNTCYTTQIRNLTNAAWTAVNITTTQTNITGSDLKASSATKLTASAINGTILQTIASLTSATYVLGFYAKRVTGTGAIFATLDGITYTDFTSQLNSSTYTWIKNIPSQTLISATPGFKIAVSGDAIDVDFCQFENASYPTTPLYTSSTPQNQISRGVDDPAFNYTNGTIFGPGYQYIKSIICSGGPWWVFCSGSGNSIATKTLTSDGGFELHIGCDGGTGYMQGATASTKATSSNTGTFGLGNINKAVGRVNGQGNAICLNGGAIAYGSSSGPIFTPPSTAFTHITIGNNGAAQFPINGYISRLAFGAGDLPDGLMQQYST